MKIKTLLQMGLSLKSHRKKYRSRKQKLKLFIAILVIKHISIDILICYNFIDISRGNTKGKIKIEHTHIK